MRELVFAMALYGRVAPVEGREGTMCAQTVGRDPLSETVRFTSHVVRQAGEATAVYLVTRSTAKGAEANGAAEQAEEHNTACDDGPMVV